MRTQNRQAVRFAIVGAIVSGLCGPVIAAPPQRGRYSQQLADECDALIETAVRRPYGWAWESVPAPANSSKSLPRQVTMQPLGTPAAALLLLWSGQVLDEPRYREAAIDVARGIAASQQASGKILNDPVFGGSAGGRDEPAVVPDRASTCAALVAMLTVRSSTNHEARSETLKRGIQRATFWLIKQQNDDGGWTSAYPPDASARDAQRLIRLETPDYRDCTFALLLAAESDDNRVVSNAASKSIQKLLDLRLAAHLDQFSADEPADGLMTGEAEPDQKLQRLKPLWSGAYRPDGSLDSKLSDFPAGADVVASRLAMQTLAGAYLLKGDQESGAAIQAAAHALKSLQRSNSKWRRVQRIQPTTMPATTQSSGIFTPPPRSDVGPDALGSFDLPSTLEMADQLQQTGREAYVKTLSSSLTLAQRLSAAVCGLTDEPFSLEQDQSAQLNTPVPRELDARLKRLWGLLLRAKIEKVQPTGAP